MWNQIQEDIYIDVHDGEFTADDLSHLMRYIDMNVFRYKSERCVIIFGAASFILSLSMNRYVFGAAFITAPLAVFCAMCAYTTKLSRFIGVYIPSSEYYDIDVYGFIGVYYVHVKKINRLRFTYDVPIDVVSRITDHQSSRLV
jgi:hypothetical protein